MKYEYSYEIRPGHRVTSVRSIPIPTIKDYEDILKCISFLNTKKSPRFDLKNVRNLSMSLTDTHGNIIRALSPREMDAVLVAGETIITIFPDEGPTGERYV